MNRLQSAQGRKNMFSSNSRIFTIHLLDSPMPTLYSLFSQMQPFQLPRMISPLKSSESLVSVSLILPRHSTLPQIQHCAREWRGMIQGEPLASCADLFSRRLPTDKISLRRIHSIGSWRWAWLHKGLRPTKPRGHAPWYEMESWYLLIIIYSFYFLSSWSLPVGGYSRLLLLLYYVLPSVSSLCHYT